MPTITDIKGVAEFLHVSIWTVRRMIKSGDIPYFRVHKSVRFNLSEIEKWTAQKTVYPTSNELVRLGAKGNPSFGRRSR